MKVVPPENDEVEVVTCRRCVNDTEYASIVTADAAPSERV